MLTHPRIARIAFAALSMMSVTALCGLTYADDETPAVHSDVPVSKGFKSAFAPNVSRAPLLDGLAASLPSTVDEIGAFSSSIPIHVPAYRGLEPAVAIQYDSNAGSGLLGMGWTLSTPSVIQRMGQDRGTPAYDDTDSFYLDGIELLPCEHPTVTGNSRKPPHRHDRKSAICDVPVSGPHNYQYYFTIRETYQRIAFDRDHGDWHVWRTSGVKYDYGLAWLTGVRRLPNRWFLTAATDPSGNAVGYDYQSCSTPPVSGAINSGLLKVASTPFASQYQPPEPINHLLLSTVARDKAGVTSENFALATAPSNTRSPVIGEISRLDKLHLKEYLHSLSIRPLPAPHATGSVPGKASIPVHESSVPRPPSGRNSSPSHIEDLLWREHPWATPATVNQTEGPAADPDSVWLNKGARFTAFRDPTMTVEYVYLRRISYGPSSVDFYLEGRPDPITFGIGDQTTAQISCRLHSIDVQTADSNGIAGRVSVHELDYVQRPDTLRSLLSRVQQFGSDATLDSKGSLTNLGNATGMPPTLLQAPTAQSVGSYTSQSQTAYAAPITENYTPPSNQFIDTQLSATYSIDSGQSKSAFAPISVDLNGDGLPDQVLVFYRDPSKFDYRVMLQPYLAMPGGGYQKLTVVDSGLGRVMTSKEAHGDKASQIGSATGSFISSQVGDIDGDGQQEIVWAYDFHDPADPLPERHYHVAVTRYDRFLGLLTGPSQSLDVPFIASIPIPSGNGDITVWKAASQYFVTDVNGDGLDDILILTEANGLPNSQACAVDVNSCILSVLLQDPTWHLVVALSNGDGTFTTQPSTAGSNSIFIPTNWPIGASLFGYWSQSGNVFMNESFWAVNDSVDYAEKMFRPGTGDRFLLMDINGDGRADLVRVANDGPLGSQHLSLCFASPRSVRTDDPSHDRFEFGCQSTSLPLLSNHEVYVAGDVNGDGRSDLVRVFEWYPGGEITKGRLYQSCEDCDYPYTQINNGHVGFQALTSLGRSFAVKSQTLSPLPWPRNYEYGADYVEQYWNAYNYFGAGWTCAPSNDNAQCHVSILRHAFYGGTTDLDPEYLSQEDDGKSYLDAFVRGQVYKDPREQTLVLDTAAAVWDPANDDLTFVIDSQPVPVHRKAVDDGRNFTYLADMNADGRADVVNWKPNDSLDSNGLRTQTWELEVFLDRLDLRPGGYARSEKPVGTTFATLADLNGNGQADVVRVETGNPSLIVDVGMRQSNGTILRNAPWRTDTWNSPDGRGREILVGDFNGDGRHDLLNLRYLPDTDSVVIHALLSKGNGAFNDVVSTPHLASPELFDDRSGVFIGDVDGDGRADIVHICRLFGLLHIDTLISNGDGTFTPRVDIVDVHDIPGQSAAFLLADVNGDGRSDLVGAWSRSDGSAVAYALLSDGKGWHAVESQFPTPGMTIAPGSWHVGDLNADRLDDLQQIGAAEHNGAYDLWILQLRSRGDGTFELQRTLGTQGFATADTRFWSSADINGDGKSDLVHARSEWGVTRVTTLIKTPGTLPLRKDWVASTSKRYPPGVVRWHPVDLGSGVASLEVLTASQSASEKPTTPTIADGWRVDQFRSLVAPDWIEKAVDSLGGISLVTYSSTAGTTTPDPNDASCSLPAGLNFRAVSKIVSHDGRSPAVGESDFTRSCPHWSPIERRNLGYKTETQQEPAVSSRPAVFTTSQFNLDDRCGRQPSWTRHSDGGLGLQATFTTYVDAELLPPHHCDMASSEELETDATGASATTLVGYTVDRFGDLQSMIEYGDSTLSGDERSTQHTFSMLPDTFHTVRDSTDIYADLAKTQLVSSQRFCFDHHTASLNSACSHAAGDAGLLTSSSVWDDHSGLWYQDLTDYDGYGNISSKTDALGHSTTTLWDSVGHLFPTEIINAKGQVEKISWDFVHGRETSRVDLNGITKTVTGYDALGRVKSIVSFDGQTTTFSYAKWGDPAHQHTRKTVTGGPWSSWVDDYFDGLGRVWTEHRLNGRGTGAYEQVWHYDDSSQDPSDFAPLHDLGSPVTQTDSYFYDFLSRPIRTVHADGSASSVQYLTRRTVATDEIGDRREALSDAYDRVVTLVEHPSTTDTEPPSVSHLSYDALGHLTGRTDALGNSWTYKVSSLGRTWQESEPDRGTTSFEFDPVGSPIKTVNGNGLVVSYGYDELNRQINRIGPSRTVKWHYDDPAVAFGIGRMSSIEDTSNACAESRQFAFDAMGRVTRDSICVDGDTGIMQFGYDQLGRLSTLTYPDGEQVTRSYDLAGWLVGLGGLVQAKYDAQNRISEIAFANGVSEKRQYDPQRGWLLSDKIRVPSLSPTESAWEESYSYALNSLTSAATTLMGVSTGVGPAARSGVSRQYSYDGVRRLTDVVAAATGSISLPAGFDVGSLSEHFTYSPIGNIASQGSLGAYEYGPDAPDCTAHMACGGGPHTTRAVKGNWFGYDADGNLIRRSSGTVIVQYHFDDADQQVGVTDSTGQVASFGYDSAGQRTFQSSGNSSKKQVTKYFGKYLELSPDRQWVKHYFLGDVIVGRQIGGKRYFFSTDRLRSVRLVTDQSGKVASTYDYSAYGSQLMGDDSVAGAYNFTSHKRDDELLGISGALLYMGARYYDPGLSRFLTADSVTPDALNPQSWNPYSYVNNGPTMAIDPDGHEDMPCMGGMCLGGPTYNMGDLMLKGAKAVWDFATYPVWAAFAPRSTSEPYMAGPSKGPGDRDIVFGAVGIIAGKAAGPVIDSVVGQIAARSAVVEGLAVSQSAVPATPAATGAMTLWPAANEGVTVINGIKYVPHALERMQPLGTIIKDGALFSRGVPVSVVENAIQLGEVTPGRTAAEVVRTFENVRVITNPEGTRVITVIKIGR